MNLVSCSAKPSRPALLTHLGVDIRGDERVDIDVTKLHFFKNLKVEDQKMLLDEIAKGKLIFLENEKPKKAVYRRIIWRGAVSWACDSDGEIYEIDENDQRYIPDFE